MLTTREKILLVRANSDSSEGGKGKGECPPLLSVFACEIRGTGGTRGNKGVTIVFIVFSHSGFSSERISLSYYHQSFIVFKMKKVIDREAKVGM